MGKLDQAIKWIYVALMVLSGLVMVAIAGAGIVELGESARTMYKDVIFGPGEVDGAPAVQSALRGIESIFLAPIGFLAINVISNYVQRRIQIGNANKGEQKVDDHSLVELKAWTLSLMIAVVATDLVGRLVGGQSIDRERVIAECAAIIILAGVWWAVYGRHE